MTVQAPITANGISRWLRIEVLAFVVQLVVIMSSLVWGYSRLESKVDELNRRLSEHLETHSVFLLKETWEVRNKFIDSKLDSIERKLDVLLERDRVGK